MLQSLPGKKEEKTMKNRILFASLALSLLLSAFVMVSGCGSAASSGGGGGGGSVGTAWIYVGNYDDSTISYIDSTNDAVASIELGTYTPYQLAASPDGKHVYGRTSGAGGDILVINTSTNTVESMFTAGDPHPYDKMAVSNDGNYLYVTRVNDSDLVKMNVASGACVPVCTFEAAPRALILNPDSTKAYVALYDNCLADVTLNTGSFTTYEVGNSWNETQSIAIKDNKVYVPASTTVTVFDTNLHTTNLITSDAQWLFTITSIPGKDKLYTPNWLVAGEMRVINSTVPTFESTVITGATFSRPTFLCPTVDGNYVYVYDPSPTYHTQICKVNTNNDSIEAFTQVGSGEDWYNNPVIVYK